MGMKRRAEWGNPTSQILIKGLPPVVFANEFAAGILQSEPLLGLDLPAAEGVLADGAPASVVIVDGPVGDGATVSVASRL